jgi:hypothetical protein
VAPDPLDPDVVYGGKVSRYDRRTGQTRNVSPRPLRGPGYRTVRTQPVLFSPVDPGVLYFASNTLWKTSDGGQHWDPISPDLTRPSWAVPENVGKYRDTPAAAATQRGVVYTLAPSYKDAGVIWAGADDGLIHVTRDGGKTWTDVTPPELGPWAKVSLIEAGRFDAATAWAAINTFRLDDLRPHVFRTHDFGRTWTRIVAGIPDGGVVNAVREDPVRRGLLFAGSEREVYVSLDAGASWQSLRLNMPATSIRDLVVKDDDLVVGTHGRSFWILDDISPLRQLNAGVLASGLHLFEPQVATRARWNQNTDTPLPQEEPAGQNPPEGAILNYYLGADATGLVTLEIEGPGGQVIRRFSSTDPPEPPVKGRNIPDYWIRPPQVLSSKAGFHRFTWDLRYPPPAVRQFGYPIAAIFGNTPREPRGPWVMPGRYLVKLTAGGRTTVQELNVRMDPRVTTTREVLREQFDLSMRAYDGLARSHAAWQEVRSVRAAIKEARARQVPADLAQRLAALDEQASALEAGRPDSPGLGRLNGQLASLLDVLQDADAAPTAQVRSALADVSGNTDQALARWKGLGAEVDAVSGLLEAAGMPRLAARP